MAKDPAFLFYTQDFYTGTQFFSDEQVGKYIRLLCAQHQHGHLPEKHMLSICKTHDEDVFHKFVKDEAGLYYNKRLEIEVNKRNSYTESRRNNAQHPKKQKVKKKKAYVKHMDTHMENENDNEIENELLTVFSAKFFSVWKKWIDYKRNEHSMKYKTIESQLQAVKNLIQLSNSDESLAEQIINHSIGNHYKGLFALKNQNDGTNRKTFTAGSKPGTSESRIQTARKW
jgi:uncharacterized protein YdaU (DUF1376 family)